MLKIQEEPRLLLKPHDAAKMLSFSERKLFDLTKSGDVPCIRVGRLVRYSIADLKTWIDTKRSVQEVAHV